MAAVDSINKYFFNLITLEFSIVYYLDFSLLINFFLWSRNNLSSKLFAQFK